MRPVFRRNPLPLGRAHRPAAGIAAAAIQAFAGTAAVATLTFAGTAAVATLTFAGTAAVATLTFACTSRRPPAPPPAAATKRVSGQLVRVEAEAQRLEIADAGRRFSIFYDERTLVRSRSTPLTTGDLREGDRIVVSLDARNGAHARLITLAGPARSPSPAAPPAATAAPPTSDLSIEDPP